MPTVIQGISVLLGLTCFGQQIPLIDLVAEPSHADIILKEDHISDYGAFQNPKPIPVLPFSVFLERIDDDPAGSRIKIITFLVTNNGTAPILFPVGRDGDRALDPEQTGRRILFLGLGSAARKTDTVLGGRLFAAASLAETVLAIPSGGSIRVKFRLADAARGWLEADRPPADVVAYCLQWSYEDSPDRYVVRHPSPTVTSRNSIKLEFK